MTTQGNELGVLVHPRGKPAYGPHFRAAWQWKDSVELSASTGSCAIGHRVYPDDMRAIAKWLTETADRIEGL